MHPAELAERAGLRGPKKRAKGDRADARHLRELLMVKRLPESWIPPAHILDLRARVRLRHTLSEQRSEWQQRIQATLYHHGCPQRRSLMVGDVREWLQAQPLPETAREQVTVALAMIDAVEAQILPIDKELRAYARCQAGCKALVAHYGIGPLVADSRSSPSWVTAPGSPPRASPCATRAWTSQCTSHQRRAPGHLSRQGPPALRWALFEAAQSACRKGSPDHDYYRETAERLGHNRACLSIARKLLKRSYHTLRELGEEALAPA